MKLKFGDLTLGTARIGVRVRCVVIPNLSVWEAKSLQYFNVPTLGSIYRIRSNVFTANYSGVLLVEIRNPEVTLLPMSGEPFFSYGSFNFVG